MGGTMTGVMMERLVLVQERYQPINNMLVVNRWGTVLPLEQNKNEKKQQHKNTWNVGIIIKVK